MAFCIYRLSDLWACNGLFFFLSVDGVLVVVLHVGITRKIQQKRINNYQGQSFECSRLSLLQLLSSIEMNLAPNDQILLYR